MIKRYNLEGEVEYLAIDKEGFFRKDKAGKTVVEKSKIWYDNLEGLSKEDAQRKFEAMIMKNYGSRFVGIKTKVTGVRD